MDEMTTYSGHDSLVESIGTLLDAAPSPDCHICQHDSGIDILEYRKLYREVYMYSCGSPFSFL